MKKCGIDGSGGLYLRNLSNVVNKIVDDSRFLHEKKLQKKINATPERSTCYQNESF
jgi:hypothetical protein